MAIVRAQLDFSPDSGNYLAKQLEAAGCKNWYGTISDNGKFNAPLFPFPGSEPWSDDGSKSPVRQLYSLNEVMYAVIGNSFRIYDDNGGYRELGKLNTSVGGLSIIANDTQIFLNDFNNGYVYQLIKTSTRNAGDFFRITGSTTFISTPIFTGRGTSDLTIGGSFIGDKNSIYRIQIDGSSSPYYSPITFSGGSLSDISIVGTYTSLQTKTYVVRIDTVGTPDKFQWSDTGGSTWNASTVDITGGVQALSSGVSIQFAHTIGHTLFSSWTFTAFPSGYQDTFRWSNDGGLTWVDSGIKITGDTQIIEDGIYASFLHTTGHVVNDFWSFATTVDSSFYAPLIPAYLDTRGIFLKQRSKRFYLTELEDFSRINALNFAQANSWPDNLIAAITVNQELILFCEKTIEFWYDVGAEGFPFLRRPNILIPYGIIAPYSLAMGAQNVLFWLGQNKDGGRTILAMSGYQVEVISNEALHQSIQEYTNIENAYGFIINWQGHTFYFLTFPDNDVTWVYDLATKRWNQRTTRRAPNYLFPNQYVEGRYLANCHVYHNSQHYIGDWSCGKIYRLSQNYYKDDDQPITCEIVTSPLHNNLNRVSIYSLQVDFQAATAAEYGDGSDPVACLQYSKDGSYGWSKEIRRGMGKTGEYQRRAKWGTLGTSRNRVFRIKTNDPVYRVLMGAVADVEDLGS